MGIGEARMSRSTARHSNDHPQRGRSCSGRIRATGSREDDTLAARPTALRAIAHGHPATATATHEIDPATIGVPRAGCRRGNLGHKLRLAKLGAGAARGAGRAHAGGCSRNANAASPTIPGCGTQRGARALTELLRRAARRFEDACGSWPDAR